MIRKATYALATIALLAAGTVASTDASAYGRGGHGFHGGRGFHGGHGFHRGFGGGHFGGFRHGGFYPRPYYHRHFRHRPYYFGGPRFYGGYGGCFVRRLVPTPWGWRYRLVNRCY